MSGVKLTFDLSDPNQTVYHRAGIIGLANTICAWNGKPPKGITASVEKRRVELEWSSELTNIAAVERLLAHSFKTSTSHLINLPGQLLDERPDLSFMVHDAIMQTFLQNTKSREVSKVAKVISIDQGENNVPFKFTYLPVKTYAHQRALGTGLLAVNRKRHEYFISQAFVPGVLQGAARIEASFSNAILLLYAMVGSTFFQITPYDRDEKKRHCILFPEVTDLHKYGEALQMLAKNAESMPFKTNTFLGRIVSSAEQAVMRYSSDMRCIERSVGCEFYKGCQLVTMGKLTWDHNQFSKTSSRIISARKNSFELSEIADNLWPSCVHILRKDGMSLLISDSPIAGLIAHNEIARRQWCNGFVSLLPIHASRLARDGQKLAKLKACIHDTLDLLVIDVFQESWRHHRSKIYSGSARAETQIGESISNEFICIVRNILRMHNSIMLATWFTEFTMAAKLKERLPSLSGRSDELNEFIFDINNFNRFQNLCLFALFSYSSKEGAKE